MIRVYTGPMYAAKSLGLIQAAKVRKKPDIDNILCFKPSKDTRDMSKIRSRVIEETLDAYVIQDLSQIKEFVTPEIDTIIIDEVQFLSGDVQELLWLTIMQNIDIYIAGLDLTSELTPFNIMPNILSIADEVYKLKARCQDCGKEARYTYCLVDKTDDILVGNSEYIPLCKDCLRERCIAMENSQNFPKHKIR